MLPIPVFRVEKNANYTTMSNYHLRDNTISFKAKGILSMFLSLPKNWNYSVSGLAAISKEGKDGILSGLKELEAAGYLERHRYRNERGRLGDSEYVIYEIPPHRRPVPATPEQGLPKLEKPTLEKPVLDYPVQDIPVWEKPMQDTPVQEKPAEEKPSQRSTEQERTDRKITDEQIERENGSPRHRYGLYRNVLLSDAEFQSLKYASVKGKDQQRFVRFHSLGEGYSEEDIQAVIAGEKKHRARIKSPLAKEDRVFNLLLVIDDKIRAKGPGYQQWATNYNLKQMAKTRIFLKEHNINSMDELREKASSTSADFDRIDKELKSAEQRLIEIAALKKNIINYAKTREVYVQYRKAGYSKAFFEAHREEITLHKAAKNAFQRMGMTKLSKVKELSEEYATVLAQKKSLYAQYRLAREEMREYQKALHNTEVFFDMDRNSEIDYHLKEEFTKAQTQK